MRALRLSLVLLALFMTAFGIADAQAEPLRIGGTLPGEIAWSPDGAHLLVAASDVTRLYRTGEWDAPLRTFPAALKAAWVNDSTVELDGIRLDVETNEQVAVSEAPEQNLITSPSGRYVLELPQVPESPVTLKDVQTDESLVIATIEIYHDIVFSHRETHLLLTIMIFDREQDAVIPVVQLWRIADGTLIDEYRLTHGSAVREARFSLDDQRFIIIEGIAGYYPTYPGSNQEFMRVFETETGFLQQNHTGQFTDVGVKISPDGQIIAYQMESDFLIWNGYKAVRTGFAPQALGEYWLPAAVFSGDSRVIAVNGGNHIGVWWLEPETDEVSLIGTIPSNKSVINLHLNQTGTLLAVGSRGDKSIIWDVRRQIVAAELDTTQSLDVVTFSPDNRFAAVLDSTWNGLTIWDMETSAMTYDWPRDAQVAPDWSYAARWEFGQLMLTDIGQDEEITLLEAEGYHGQSIAIDPAMNWALFDQRDQLVAYDLTTGDEKFTLPVEGRVSKVMPSADGSRIAVYEEPFAYRFSRHNEPPLRVKTWDSSGVLISVIELESLPHLVAFSPDGAYVVVHAQYSFRGSAHSEIYDAQTGEHLSTWYQDSGPITAIEFHPEKPFLAVVIDEWNGYDLFYLLDIPATAALNDGTFGTGIVRFVANQFEGNGSETLFSRSGGFFATGCRSDMFCGLDLRDLPPTGALIGSMENDFRVSYASAITFDARETMLLIKAAQTNEARLQLVETSENIGTLPAISNAIALNTDGTLAATVIDDGIALWDVDAVRAGDLAPLAVYPVSGLAPTQLRFDADDRLIALEPSGVTVYDPPVVSGQ